MNNLPKKPLVLYFINGFQHTVDELIDAQKYSLAKVEYRNALLVEGEEPDVAGVAAMHKSTIPPCYAKYPTAQEAIDEYQDAIAAMRKASGDQLAPEPTTSAAERPEFGKDEEPKPAKKK
jgi:hypothetical protein